MLFSTIAQIGFIALVLVTGFALIVGRRWARLSAILHAVNWIAVSLLQDRSGPNVFQWSNLTVDVVGAVLAVWLAVASRRSWAAWIAAFQLLGVANRIVAPLVLSHRTTVTTSYVWEAGALLAIVVGAIMQRREPSPRHRSPAQPER